MPLFEGHARQHRRHDHTCLSDAAFGCRHGLGPRAAPIRRAEATGIGKIDAYFRSDHSRAGACRGAMCMGQRPTGTARDCGSVRWLIPNHRLVRDVGAECRRNWCVSRRYVGGLKTLLLRRAEAGLPHSEGSTQPPRAQIIGDGALAGRAGHQTEPGFTYSESRRERNIT